MPLSRRLDGSNLLRLCQFAQWRGSGDLKLPPASGNKYLPGLSGTKPLCKVGGEGPSAGGGEPLQLICNGPKTDTGVDAACWGVLHLGVEHPGWGQQQGSSALAVSCLLCEGAASLLSGAAEPAHRALAGCNRDCARRECAWCLLLDGHASRLSATG